MISTISTEEKRNQTKSRGGGDWDDVGWFEHLNAPVNEDIRIYNSFSGWMDLHPLKYWGKACK